MVKAYLLFSTMLITLASWNLPKVNTGLSTGGKNIKAGEINLVNFTSSDTNDLPILPPLEIQAPSGEYKVRTVVIDPGHGGHDPGCSGVHSREKHVALAIAKYLKEDLKHKYPGINVIMTRTSDVFVPLHERAAIATRNKADLFISIHCNAFPKSSRVHGVETYVLGLHATKENLEVAKRENEAILFEDNYRETYGYDPNSTEAHIMFSMFQNAYLEQSISFAEKVQRNAVDLAKRNDRGVKQAGFLVLRYATMPSVLVEAGFLTNNMEEEYLKTQQGQQNMARVILRAFEEYKIETEKIEGVTLEPVASLEFEAPVSGDSGFQAVDDKKVLPVKQDAIISRQASNQSPAEQVIAPPAEEKKPAMTNTSPVRQSRILPTTPVTPAPPAAVPDEPEKRRVQFCVQLAASPKLLDVSRGKWARIDQTVEVVEEGGLYKYQIRNFAALNDADEVRAQLRSIGFSDAFIVAYENGKKVDPRSISR